MDQAGSFGLVQGFASRGVAAQIQGERFTAEQRPIARGLLRLSRIERVALEGDRAAVAWVADRMFTAGSCVQQLVCPAICFARRPWINS